MSIIKQAVREAALCEKLDGGRARCLACAHRCLTAPGGAGRCGVRFNDGGRLMAPWGYVSGAAIDPVEKKPFFHVLPGALTLSYGMYGCNFRCDFCQNYDISDAATANWNPQRATPRELAQAAKAEGLELVVSTYNEPLITAEWSAAVFAEAKKLGLRTAFVSNGYATPEAAAYLRPVLDLWKVDLKGFDAARYSKVCGGELDKVKAGLETIIGAGFWVEVVTLVVPGFNDSPAELEAIAGYLAGLSKDLPWHITAFHPAHRMSGSAPTTEASLEKAREAGLSKGLRYVYCGNLRSRGGGLEDTFCPSCGRAAVRRDGFRVTGYSLRAGGVCDCGAKLPGVWR